MPLLQVRGIPQELYETLSRVAQMENRSISQQTIALLKKALNITNERMARRKSVLQEIDNIHTLQNANTPPSEAGRGIVVLDSNAAIEVVLSPYLKITWKP
jgi:hypothetical protein